MKKCDVISHFISGNCNAEGGTVSWRNILVSPYAGYSIYSGRCLLIGGELMGFVSTKGTVLLRDRLFLECRDIFDMVTAIHSVRTLVYKVQPRDVVSFVSRNSYCKLSSRWCSTLLLQGAHPDVIDCANRLMISCRRDDRFSYPQLAITYSNEIASAVAARKLKKAKQMNAFVPLINRRVREHEEKREADIRNCLANKEAELQEIGL